MKKMILLILMFYAPFAYSYETAQRLNWQQIFVPLNEDCNPHYSMHPMEIICRSDGRLYFRAYEIDYEVDGQRGKVRLTYIPEATFLIDKDGTVKPRNFEVMPNQRY